MIYSIFFVFIHFDVEDNYEDKDDGYDDYADLDY